VATTCIITIIKTTRLLVTEAVSVTGWPMQGVGMAGWPTGSSFVNKVEDTEDSKPKDGHR